MAFKRANFNGFKSNALKSFSSQYKFSKQADFKEEGKEVYVIPLGLENGFYESPCHRVKTHKVNGQVIGFKGLSFDATIKCKGIDEDGSRVESLCCTLAAMERERFPENEDYAKRIVSSQTWKVHIPVLILGNCTGEKKKAFPLLVKHSIRTDILLNSIELKNSNENIQEERKEDTFFPSKIIGNVEKKGRLLGLNNPRYLELDCIKGLIKRYKSTDDYPEKPK